MIALFTLQDQSEDQPVFPASVGASNGTADNGSEATAAPPARPAAPNIVPVNDRVLNMEVSWWISSFY